MRNFFNFSSPISSLMGVAPGLEGEGAGRNPEKAVPTSNGTAMEKLQQTDCRASANIYRRCSLDHALAPGDLIVGNQIQCSKLSNRREPLSTRGFSLAGARRAPSTASKG